jgi:hypothetical protein
MTWWVCEREMIATANMAKTASEEGWNKGVLRGLKRAWPPAVGCGYGGTEVEEESGNTAAKDKGAVAEEGACTTGAAEEEVIKGCSIAKRERWWKCFS